MAQVKARGLCRPLSASTAAHFPPAVCLCNRAPTAQYRGWPVLPGLIHKVHLAKSSARRRGGPWAQPGAVKLGDTLMWPLPSRPHRHGSAASGVGHGEARRQFIYSLVGAAEGMAVPQSVSWGRRAGHGQAGGPGKSWGPGCPHPQLGPCRFLSLESCWGSSRLMGGGVGALAGWPLPKGSP